jgi:hypothetical protein
VTASHPHDDDARARGPDHPIPVIPPRPDAVAEVSGVRRRDLEDLHDRMSHLSHPLRGRFWEPTGKLLLGAALAGFVAGVPLSGGRGNASWVVPTYWAIVCVLVLLGLICVAAARTLRGQNEDSLASIASALRRLLDAYGAEEPDPRQPDTRLAPP